ncbi:MAG: hypothetical protein L3J76_05735, partial [Candidatus Hydrothermae bacterium]|nr:hypothetical protein [Candidatus Hydrothermae bacterium]
MRLRRLRGVSVADGLAFFWGMAEATLFFLVPDVWITGRALRGVRSGIRAAFWAGAGALLGGMGMYIWGARAPHTALQWVDAVPNISATMIQQVQQQLAHFGYLALWVGAFSGKPYKIYAVQAGAAHMPLIPFMLMSFLARLTRFLLLGCHLFERFGSLRAFPKRSL